MTDALGADQARRVQPVADLAGLLDRVAISDAEVESQAVDAAAAVLDIGIHLLGETEPEAASGPAVPRRVSGRVIAALAATPITSSMLLSRDVGARRAFILGGPDAVVGWARESDRQ